MPSDPTPPTTDTIRLSPEALKVLAHPLRSRLLGRLRHRGRATATELAEDLSTNSGATSYHLRKLEEVGLVEDTGDGAGRRRLWAPASRMHSWQPSDFEGDEDAETALGWLTRDYLRLLGERAERWMDVAETWPMEWQHAVGVGDDGVVVTAAQAQAMREEMHEVVERYRRVGQGNPSARRVAAWIVTYPIDLDNPPRGTAS